MIGRVVWFALGAGSAVWAASKARSYVRAASPQAIGQRVAGSAAGLGDSVRDFLDRVRAASAEREAELRTLLEQRGASHRALPGRAADSDRLGLPE